MFNMWVGVIFLVNLVEVVELMFLRIVEDVIGCNDEVIFFEFCYMGDVIVG